MKTIIWVPYKDFPLEQFVDGWYLQWDGLWVREE